MDATSEFKFKILSRKRSPDEYRIYQAALEWDLTDPIVIESQDDFKSAYRWQDRLTPYLHQVSNLITFCRRLPVTLLADDVGLGKTISAGLVISELVARSRITKILIVCPKILAQQWKEELDSKFNIPAVVAFGKDLIDADPDEIGAVITTYNSARLHLDKIPEDRFQMLVLDEAHKLRNLYGVQKTPEVAKRFRKALEDRRFPFVLMLTATPIQNRLWDLYSLVDLLTVARGHDNPFGTPGMFARQFIADISGKKYRIDQQVQSAVSGRMGHKQEFVICHETRQPMAADEIEKCEITGHPVRIGVLERCEISGKKVLPVGLERCSVSGKRALKRFLVNSSISNTRLLREVAIQSTSGIFCAPGEAATCTWSNRKSHPDDIRRCQLSGLPIHSDYSTPSKPYRLLPLIEMLNGIRRNSDNADLWKRVADLLGVATKGGKYTVEAAILSTSGQYLATCSEIRTMLGLRSYHVGALYDLASDSIAGRIAKGKRGKEAWIESSS